MTTRKVVLLYRCPKKLMPQQVFSSSGSMQSISGQPYMVSSGSNPLWYENSPPEPAKMLLKQSKFTTALKTDWF
jgi:hypothetical protein